jgi:pSer/pThr/pTyr-binding forkhead associated (FHA) protein
VSPPPPPPPTLSQRPIADAAPLPSSNPNVPTLVFHVVQQGRPPREVVTNNEVLKIGKMPRAHLKIDDDPNVSRMHAVIEVKRDAIEVIDLGSMTGTFVNDNQVNKATVVVGDTIRVGGTELVLISVA